MSSDIKIAMITVCFPPDHGGAGTQSLTLANALKKLGVNCIFLTPMQGNTCIYESMEGLEVFRIDTKTKLPRLKWLFFSVCIISMLLKRRKKIDVVHLHSIFPFSFMINLFCKLFSKPLIVKLTLMGNDDPLSLYKKGWLFNIEANNLKRVDRVICISKALFGSCLASGLSPARLASIPNSVDVNKFSPVVSATQKQELRKKLSLPQNDIIACFVGRFSLRKGCDILCEAWSKVLDNHQNISLLVVGPYEPYDSIPPREATLVAELLQEKERKKIIFVGQSDNVADYMRASDLFVFPSRSEGFPSVVIEAMASGLPVLTTKMGGTALEIIEHGHDGLIVDDGDWKGISHWLNELIQKDELRELLSANGLSKAHQEYDSKVIAERYRLLYQELQDQKVVSQ